MATINRPTPFARGRKRYEEVLAAGATVVGVNDIHSERVSYSVHPTAGNMQVEVTLDTTDAIEADSAEWSEVTNSPYAGDASEAVIAPITAMRFTGTGKIMVQSKD